MREQSVAAEGLSRELQTLSSSASSLRQAGRSLLELLERRWGLERSVFLVRIGEALDGVATGIPEEEFHELLEGVSGHGSGLLESSVGEVGQLLVRRSLSANGDTEREFRVIPFGYEPARLSGAVMVEDPAEVGWSEPFSRALQGAVPTLARLAEADALRRELERARGEASGLRAIFDTLPDPVLVMDRDGRVLMANRRADQLLMSHEDDSPGRRHAVETNSLFFSAFQARSYLGEQPRGELLQVDPNDGSDLLFEVSTMEIPGGDGSAESSIYMLRDISDLKRASTELERQYRKSVAQEHRARQESERLNVILENAGVPILVTDEWNDIVLMNRDAERLFEAGDAAGRSPKVRDVRANDAKITSLISDALLRPGLRIEEELQLVDPDGGGEFPVRVVLNKILNRREEPTTVVCVIHDLTEKVEVQRLAVELRHLNQDLEARIDRATREITERNRELERQREELVRASRLKTEFLAMMSHELRTPINAVLGYNSLLRDRILGELNDRQLGALARMESASDHLLTLINDVLDLSKVEAGKISLNPMDVPVAVFLQNVAEEVRPMAEADGLDFAVEVGDPEAAVRADPTRLRQVLLNLASNAVKFTPEGRVSLRGTVGEDHSRVRFEVVDTGIGIREEHREAIFEEFRQIENFATRERGGTGLGLAISRRLIALMGGRLEVESEVGRGSVFSFELPAGERRASGR